MSGRKRRETSGPSERWLPAPVAGYEVSDLGRVRSVDRVVEDTGKGGTSRRRLMRGKLLKLQDARNAAGHLKVALGRGCWFWVHRLVWETFRGPIPAGCHVCHDDNQGHRNHLTNLRLDNPKGNAADRKRHGTHLQGEQHPGAILTERAVREIREKYSELPRIEVAQMFGVHPNTITNIVKGRAWAWFQ